MAFILNKALLRCQIQRELANYNNHRYVYLITTIKRNYFWNAKLREHNRYEYNSSELVKCLKKLELVGCSPINQDNLLHYLSNHLKGNDFQTKENVSLMINVINYAFKSNQSIENVIQDPGVVSFLTQVELHTKYMNFDELVSALIACGSIKIPLSSSVARQLTIAVGRKMKGSFCLIRKLVLFIYFSFVLWKSNNYRVNAVAITAINEFSDFFKATFKPNVSIFNLC